ncbi:MAG: ACP S-malonyltransferase [Alkalispirochaetaceae bacterium]
MKRVFLYPGQGAQYPGMGKDLYDENETVRELFRTAREVAGFDVTDLVFNGSEEDLKATDNTQIAITIVNLAAATVIAERGLPSHGAAGFSLGEYAALVDAGVLEAKEALFAVRERGRLMEEASRRLDSDSGSVGMIAAIGKDYTEIVEILDTIGLENAYPAIYNSPVQTVIGGDAEAMALLPEKLKEYGIRRAVPLKVSGPFHTPLMEEARLELSKVFATLEFRDPKKPVYSNVTGAQIGSGEEARRRCLEQLVSTVMWTREEEALLSEGYTQLIEAGPGTVLAGLWKSYAKSAGIEKPFVEPGGTVDEISALRGDQHAS